ncbi:Aquaporin-9 [Halotydeus destructor]|nr:Aquaporin-9 [Halotydeus destructor]
MPKSDHSKLAQSKESFQNIFRTSVVRECLAEFFGTLVLVTFGNASTAAYVLRDGPVDVFAICFCWGIGVMVGIMVAGSVSGAHLNPAITFALAGLGKFPWKKVAYYIISQLFGGFFASLIVYVTYLDGIHALDGGLRSAYGSNMSTGAIFSTYPASFVSVKTVLIDEIVCTGLLAYAAFAIGDAKRMKVPQHLQPLAMGSVVTAICLAFGLNSGAALNPARDFAPRLFTAVAGWGWEPFEVLGGNYWWAAGIVGPCIGALVGGYLYQLSIDIDTESGSLSTIHPMSEASHGEDQVLEVVTTEKEIDEIREITKTLEKNSPRTRNC